MTVIDSTSAGAAPVGAVRHVGAPAIDLGVLDAIVASHLMPLGRERGINSLLEGAEAECIAQGAIYSLCFVDDIEDRGRFAFGFLSDGFQLALELVALVSKSPFTINEPAVRELIDQTRDRLTDHYKHFQKIYGQLGDE